MRVMTREFSRQSDSRNPVSGLLFPSVVRDSIFDRAKTRLNGRGGKGGRRTRKQGTRVYSATPLDTDGMFQQRGGGQLWKVASGFRRVETFLFSSKLSARGRSFRFRSSFAFNEDPAEYSETPRRALLYTQVPVSFCREREREKKENKKEQKGGEELGRLINFLITLSSTDSLSFFFFVSSCYYIPWTSKKKEEKRAEY